LVPHKKFDCTQRGKAPLAFTQYIHLRSLCPSTSLPLRKSSAKLPTTQSIDFYCFVKMSCRVPDFPHSPKKRNTPTNISVLFELSFVVVRPLPFCGIFINCFVVVFIEIFEVTFVIVAPIPIQNNERRTNKNNF